MDHGKVPSDWREVDPDTWYNSDLIGVLCGIHGIPLDDALGLIPVKRLVPDAAKGFVLGRHLIEFFQPRDLR